MIVIIWPIYIYTYYIKYYNIAYYIKYNNITYYIVIISNIGCRSYSIYFMNQAAAGQDLIKGRIWPAGRTLDMPAIGELID